MNYFLSLVPGRTSVFPYEPSDVRGVVTPDSSVSGGRGAPLRPPGHRTATRLGDPTRSEGAQQRKLA